VRWPGRSKNDRPGHSSTRKELPMTDSDEDRAGISATTFLMLGIWLGPDRAVFLIVVVAIVSLWFLACRRWPWFAWFTINFLNGLFRR
jgi:hypothetical protein